MTDPVMEGLPFKQYGSHTFLPFSLPAAAVGLEPLTLR
jgi:hypothetical protein